MTRAPVVAWAILALALFPSIHGHARAEGPVSLETETTGMEHDCPGDALPKSCPIEWNPNEPSTPGDDEFGAVVFVDEVRVTVQPPLGEGPPTTFSFALQDVKVEHPINRELNRTWVKLNDTRPELAQSLVAFESRPKRTYNDDGSWVEGEWGLFLVVYGPATGPLAPFAWCWDFCSLDNQTYLHGSEDELQPFPNGGYVRDWTHDELSTDGLMEWAFYEVPNCGDELMVIHCPDPSNQEIIREAVQQYRNATPEVTGGFQFNRTSVSLNATEDASLRAAGSGPPFPLGRKSPGLPPTRNASAAGLSSPHEQQISPLSLPSREDGGTPGPFRPPTTPTAVQGVRSLRVDVLLLTAGTATAILALLGWLLYHRMSSREALHQETRRRILEVVTARPGLRVASIAASLGVSHNTVKYHVSRLESWGLLRAGPGAQPGYFPLTKAPMEAAAIGILVNPTLRALHDAVMTKREMDHSALGATLGLHLSTVGRAVARLEAAGLVMQTRVGRRVIVRLAKATPEGTVPPLTPVVS